MLNVQYSIVVRCNGHAECPVFYSGEMHTAMLNVQYSIVVRCNCHAECPVFYSGEMQRPC